MAKPSRSPSWVFGLLLGLVALALPRASAACDRLHPDVSSPPRVESTAVVLEGRLNINTATAAQWVLLPGIGPATADKIIAYRERYRFRRLVHLMRVKGIGRKTFERLRPYLTLEGETTLHPVVASLEHRGPPR